MMSRLFPLIERPVWPRVLQRAQELADKGYSRSSTCRAVGREFGFHESSFHNACRRGDVPAYPAVDEKRATARRKGKTVFEGQSCHACGTNERWVGDNVCVKCSLEKKRLEAASRDRVPIDKKLKQIPLIKRSFWGELLFRAIELASEGKSVSGAGHILASEFPVSEAAFTHACNRGDVPAYPSDQVDRVLARVDGHTQYVGQTCETCGSNIRYTSINTCVQCDTDYMRHWTGAGKGQ